MQNIRVFPAVSILFFSLMIAILSFKVCGDNVISAQLFKQYTAVQTCFATAGEFDARQAAL
ncbi:hypothetical protein ASG35_24320 [Burkholderia sp. Leaf177]|nr:hypothetical protein ASG35_24320 [Burkholderia sp. Leaf177]